MVTAGNPQIVAGALASRAEAAVSAISSQVIRHGVNDLPAEKHAFGECSEWPLPVLPATATDQELIVRMDRALKVAYGKYSYSPRFRVGWQHYDGVRKGLQVRSRKIEEPAGSVIRHHLARMKSLRALARPHPKIVAVAGQVRSILDRGEKVLLFCDHIAPAPGSRPLP